MISIKKATQTDAPVIALLARVTFTESFGHYFRDKQDIFDYFEKKFSVEKMKSSLQKENNVFWIAYWNDLPIGFLKLKKYSPVESLGDKAVSQLQKIYLLKEFIGKRIGNELMKEAESYMLANNLRHMWLSVLIFNDIAIKFYTKNGFSQIGTQMYQIGKETFHYYVLYKQIGNAE